MSSTREYVIPFGSYSLGRHQFEFEITGTFFEEFPDSEMKQAFIKVKVTLTKQDRALEFNFEIKGTVELSCDRCLELFQQPIDEEYSLYGKFGHGRSDDEFDVVWIEYSENVIDLKQFLYEYIVLSIPLRRVHPKKSGGKPGCNPEMLELIKHMRNN